MRSTTRVVLSNYWHKPGVRITLFHEDKIAPNGGISLSISLDDFIQALAYEMPEKLDVLIKSCDSALEKIKESSVPIAG